MANNKVNQYLNTEYCAGDSNKTKQYREENNNEVDALSKELGMGCIVDAVKRPPNICVETCVYKDSESENEEEPPRTQPVEEDNYSDEFEEEKSEDEEIQIPKVDDEKSTEYMKSSSKTSVSKAASVSGRSTGYGSVSVPKTRRINMSFTNDRLREIERHNHILLNKIMRARNSHKSSIPARETSRSVPPPAAAHRRQIQRQIDRDNLILLKKIQQAKSSSSSLRR